MGHRAHCIVIKNHQAVAYYDQWAGLGCAFGIADGPEAAVAYLDQFQTTNQLLSWALAEGGYLLDFDEHRVIVFGSLDPELDELDEVDEGSLSVKLDPENSDHESHMPNFRSFFESIASQWRGWILCHDERGVDAFADHLARRGILSIETPPPSHPQIAEYFEFQA
jgi:hypothetical protein